MVAGKDAVCGSPHPHTFVNYVSYMLINTVLTYSLLEGL